MSESNEPIQDEPQIEGVADQGNAEPAEERGPEPQDELQTLTAERDRLKDQLLRMAADFDNYRKRARRDVEDAQRRTQEETVREILPVIDNLERASAAAEQAPDAAAVIEGVQMVLRGFDEVASRLGVTRVAAQGERFDPSLHDAVQQVESAEHPPGTVVAELVPGYKLRDKLIRAAMVVVAKAPPAPPKAEQPS